MGELSTLYFGNLILGFVGSDEIAAAVFTVIMGNCCFHSHNFVRSRLNLLDKFSRSLSTYTKT